MGCVRCPSSPPHQQRNARRLVQQRYDWQQIGQRFVALVEELDKQMADARCMLSVPRHNQSLS